MPMSTDVALPRARVAAFPDRCVVCGAASPGGTYAVGTGSFARGAALVGLPWREASLIRAPACPACGRLIWAQRLVAFGLSAAAIAAAMIYLWPMVKPHLPRAGHTFAKFGIAMVAVAPQVLWSVFHPPPFDVTVGDEEIEYEFADRQYAVDFAAANAAAGGVTIEGVPVDPGGPP